MVHYKYKWNNKGQLVSMGECFPLEKEVGK